MKKKQIAVIITVLAIIGLLFYFNTASAPKINTEIPTEETASQKIDINTVCEGALAHMSFPDGASADAFVAECKEGKHPEVIEQYRANLNIEGGAAI